MVGEHKPDQEIQTDPSLIEAELKDAVTQYQEDLRHFELAQENLGQSEKHIEEVWRQALIGKKILVNGPIDIEMLENMEWASNRPSLENEVMVVDAVHLRQRFKTLPHKFPYVFGATTSKRMIAAWIGSGPGCLQWQLEEDS